MGFGTNTVAATRYETLGAGTGQGTVVTGSGAQILSSWVTIGTTGFQYDGFILCASSSSGVRGIINIGVGAGGTPKTIVSNIFIPNPPQEIQLNIPVRIPAGATVKAQVAGSGATNTYAVLVTGYGADNRLLKGFSQLISCSDLSGGIDPPTVTLSGTTQTGWVINCASTSNEIAGLYVAEDDKGNGANQQVLWDIGWGAAGSERVLFRTIFQDSICTPVWGPIPCRIPAGSRLAVRAQASAANTQSKGLVLNGLVP